MLVFAIHLIQNENSKNPAFMLLIFVNIFNKLAIEKMRTKGNSRLFDRLSNSS